jgi:hypothetical protein
MRSFRCRDVSSYPCCISSIDPAPQRQTAYMPAAEAKYSLSLMGMLCSYCLLICLLPNADDQMSLPERTID